MYMQTQTDCTWPQWRFCFPAVIWPAGWWCGWEPSRIHTTECSRTAAHPRTNEYNFIRCCLIPVLQCCCENRYMNAERIRWDKSTFLGSMMEGRKEDVVSSVMRRRGEEFWYSSACLAFLFSSPTKCLCKWLYGALKFLMKASFKVTQQQNYNQGHKANQMLIMDILTSNKVTTTSVSFKFLSVNYSLKAFAHLQDANNRDWPRSVNLLICKICKTAVCLGLLSLKLEILCGNYQFLNHYNHDT